MVIAKVIITWSIITGYSMVIAKVIITWSIITGYCIQHGNCRGNYSRVNYNRMAVAFMIISHAWWCHPMETFSALLAICAGNSPASGEFPAQRPVMRSLDVFFDLCLNKQLRKQPWGWWFETLSCPLWRHCNGRCECLAYYTVQDFVVYTEFMFRKHTTIWN